MPICFYLFLAVKRIKNRNKSEHHFSDLFIFCDLVIWRPWVNLNIFDFNFSCSHVSIACHLLLAFSLLFFSTEVVAMRNAKLFKMMTWYDFSYSSRKILHVSHSKRKKSQKHMLHSIKTNLCFCLNDGDLYLMWANFCFMAKMAIDKIKLCKMTCAMRTKHNAQIHRSTNPVEVVLISNSLFWGQTTNG